MQQQQQRTPIARAEFVDTGEGTRAFFAVPQGAGPFPAVLLFQEAFGINDYIQSEVRRLAEHGYVAIAPDLFAGKTYPYEDMGPVFAALQALTDEGMLTHVRNAKRFLDARADVVHGRYGAVGFCMGGRLAFLTAATFPDEIVAAASFYGGGIAPEQKRFFEPLVDRVPELRAELLMIYGADDESIPPTEHARLAQALSTGKKRYSLSVFPDAPHGFASRDRTPVYRRDPAEAAWAQTLALFDRTLR